MANAYKQFHVELRQTNRWILTVNARNCLEAKIKAFSQAQDEEPEDGPLEVYSCYALLKERQ